MSARTAIIVKFGEEVADSSDYFVQAEVDKMTDASGSVKTQFNPGDRPSIIVQHDSKVRIRDVKSSIGQIIVGGNVNRSMDTTLVFTERDEEHQLSYIAGGISYEWFGNEASISSEADRKLRCTGGQLPAICKATLSCTFKQYTLAANIPADLTPDDDFLVAIVIYMEVI